MLDKFGSDFLQRNAETAAVADDPIHVLNPVERAGLRRVARGAVVRAVLAGVLNAIATGLCDLYAAHLFGPLPEHAQLGQRVAYWSVFGTGAVVFAILEILYLGWDGLHSVRRLSALAGMELSAAENREVALALARAALELPNPPEAVMGVNPHREASRAQLVVASAVYKLKIFVTNFVFKQVMQHALPKLATRYVLAFTAIPINGLWNGLVTQELHPNHVAIVRAVRLRLGEPPAELELDDSDIFLKQLPGLELAERRVVLRVLAIAAFLDGRLVRAEKRLLSEAYHAAELPPRLDHVEKLRRAFVAGDIIPHDDLRSAAT